MHTVFTYAQKWGRAGDWIHYLNAESEITGGQWPFTMHIGNITDQIADR